MWFSPSSSDDDALADKLRLNLMPPASNHHRLRPSVAIKPQQMVWPATNSTFSFRLFHHIFRPSPSVVFSPIQRYGRPLVSSPELRDIITCNHMTCCKRDQPAKTAHGNRQDCAERSVRFGLRSRDALAALAGHFFEISAAAK